MTVSAAPYPFLTPPTSDDFLGSLAHYRVISELGRGGMGFVFRAEDAKLKRPVALKVMNQKISAIAGSRKRFISEARAMAAVHHDNVATIFEVGESGGTPFMAMEMLRGETLEALNKRGNQLDFQTIIKYATDIARGLGAAHARGIVHRDIKPANIWIEAGSDRIKILDFGLALASTPIDHLAGRGAVVGTPGYLAPEQARSDPLDDRSDLYSLGVVLYELCTGRIPIQSKSVHAQLISILAHRPTPINELNPDIPKPLCDAVHRLLRKEPRSRFQSAKVLETELVKVEEECVQQSEVVQAINRLKEGLSLVLPTDPAPAPAPAPIPKPKPEQDAFSALDEIPAPVLDPLAGVTIPMPSKMKSASARKSISRLKTPASAAPSWQRYLPLVIIVGLLLLAVPVLTFAFTSFGGGSAPSVVASDPDTEPDQPKKRVVPPKPPANTPKPKPKPRPKPRKKNRGNANQPTTPSPANNSGPRGNDAASRDTKVVPDKATSSPKIPTLDSKTTKSKPPEAPLVPTTVVKISTALERGADAMVQNGTNERFGEKKSLGVRTKGGVEVNHTYMRFDLSTLGNKKQRSKITAARLVLNVVGGKSPKGAEIRLVGIDDVGMWPEALIAWANSPSNVQAKKTLNQFPMLARETFTAKALAKQQSKSTVYIGGPDLVKYLKNATDTVTLAVAGSWEERLLRFISRERSPGEAPTLEVAIAR